MAGQNIPILAMREYDASALSAYSTEIIPVVRKLSVAEFATGQLLVRVHEATASQGSIDVQLVRSSPSSDEPDGDFVDAATPVAAITITSHTAAGSLLRAPLAAKFGGHLQLRLKATQGSKSLATLRATISAELAVQE